MISPKTLGELLTLLERREAALIEWGFYDVRHTAQEIAELFGDSSVYGDEFREAANESSEELFIDDLAGAQALHRVADSYPPAYRSRFAESVRLLARLKQRFKADDWLSAPDLVSEVRLHLAPRRVPKREISLEKVWGQIASACWERDIQKAVLEALCGKGTAAQTLAAFQVRAIDRVLRHYRGNVDPTGSVVTAGTGGGKTKAFYIPALMGIAADVKVDSRPATKVLSIYPRNVLLTDQFSEAASQANQVNQVLARQLGRPITVGALVGDVPLSADFEGDKRNQLWLKNWQRKAAANAWSPPHIRHPVTGDELLWLDEDRRSGRTTLRENTSAQAVVFPDGLVVLSREQLRLRPPDIFLTSVEMLNKEISSEIGRELLGFGRPTESLRLVLLDEIHTYEGITGAQVPWILRRLAYWTKVYGRRTSPHYVGLSATLHDAVGHLATLCGIHENATVEISPSEAADEIAISGNEYNVALKSQTGNGTSVLSTSIQVAMLGARLLTPRNAGSGVADDKIGPQFFGRKVFGFTDNLDVVNRWLPNFMDAEGKLGLAGLRASTPGDAPVDQAGQTWRLSENLGHQLRTRLKVARTSSQDPGVDAGADLVFATSSLEVGFDDPDVGMVLQHKAPRSPASFLQRKGRAGRRPGVRPWCVVVLSGHGRDRWAFRDSERLFSPVLDRLSLPAFNPYVLRIQATWFLVDWIAKRVGEGSPNLYLSRQTPQVWRAKEVVAALIHSAEEREAFTRDIQYWLRSGTTGMSAADVTALVHDILWSPPRSVLRSVVPDLFKELTYDFSVKTTERPRLLPKFIPSNTWDVLDSQEAELTTPNEAPIYLDAGKALNEAVPGRASRRFVVDPKMPSRWIKCSEALLADPTPEVLDIADLFTKSEPIDSDSGFKVVQPLALSIDALPDKVKASSNAFWKWRVEARRVGQPEEVDYHGGTVLSTLCESSALWLHRNQAHMRVLRLASQFRFDIQMDQGGTCRGTVSLTEDGIGGASVPAAVGYARTVDGLELRLKSSVVEAAPALPESVLKDLRPLFFRVQAGQSSVLARYTSTFGIQSLCDSAIGMLVSTALKHRVGLKDAWDLIEDKRDLARQVLQTISSAGQGQDDLDEGRRTTDVLDLWLQDEIVVEMEQLSSSLWAETSDELRAWLQQLRLETARATVEAAVAAILPETADGEMAVDVVELDGGYSILVTEVVAGGVGVIERLRAEIEAQPGIIDAAMRDALVNCRNEQLILSVAESARVACNPKSDVAVAVADIRGAASYTEHLSAKDALIRELDVAGLRYDREAIVALMGKAMMPGSTALSDRWVHLLWRARERVSTRLRINIDVRLFSYWLLTQRGVRRRIEQVVAAMAYTTPTPAQLFHALNRLTLDRCQDTCSECLGSPREIEGKAASRRVARAWLNFENTGRIVEVDDKEAWIAEFEDALRLVGRITLRYPTHRRTTVAVALAKRLAKEVDRGFMTASFQISGVNRTGDRWETLINVDTNEVG